MKNEIDKIFEKFYNKQPEGTKAFLDTIGFWKIKSDVKKLLHESVPFRKHMDEVIVWQEQCKDLEQKIKELEKRIEELEEGAKSGIAESMVIFRENQQLQKKIKKLEEENREWKLAHGLLEQIKKGELIPEQSVDGILKLKRKIKELKKERDIQYGDYKKFKKWIIKHGIPVNWGIWITEFIDEKIKQLKKRLKEQPKKIFDEIEKCIYVDEFDRQTCQYNTVKYDKLKKKWVKKESLLPKDKKEVKIDGKRRK